MEHFGNAHHYILPGSLFHQAMNKKVGQFMVWKERCTDAATLRKMNTKVKESGDVPQTKLV